jgi:hypothetical protein
MDGLRFPARRLEQLVQQFAGRHLRRHLVGGAILSLFRHKICGCLLLPFLRSAKMPIRALARGELVDAGDVASFEGFVKRLHIAVSSLPAA